MIMGWRVLTAGFLVWMCVVTASAAVQRSRADQQRDDEQTLQNQQMELMLLREQIQRDTAISEITRKLTDVERSATDALAEVREMRKAIYGLSGTLILSLLMQGFQIRRTGRSGT